MSRTVTVNELISRIQYQCDIQGLTVRHTPTELTTLINQAIQAHRERVSFSGIAHYLVSYNTTLTEGVTSPYRFAVLDLSSGPSPAITRVWAVDMTVSGVVKTLDAVSFSERNDYDHIPNEPVAWAPMQTYKIAILPAPNQAYAISVWYLPKLADIATTDTFDGVAGWEDEIVYEVCCRVVNRDQYAQAFQMLSTERDRAIAAVMLNARTPARSIIHRRRDTLGERRAHTDSRWRSPAEIWWGRR